MTSLFSAGGDLGPCELLYGPVHFVVVSQKAAAWLSVMVDELHLHPGALVAVLTNSAPGCSVFGVAIAGIV